MSLRKSKKRKSTGRTAPIHEVRDEDIIDVIIGADEEKARLDLEQREHQAPVEPGVPEEAIGDLDTLRYGEEREPRRMPPPPPQPQRDVAPAAEQGLARD